MLKPLKGIAPQNLISFDDLNCQFIRIRFLWIFVAKLLSGQKS